MTMDTLKMVYSHALMSVQGILIQLNQYGMDRDHLSDSGWVLTISAHILGNFGPNLANCIPQMTMKTPKFAY